MDQELGFVPILKRFINESSAHRVSNDIAAANSAAVTIDRRRLQDLSQGKDVSIKPSELFALERYFLTRGESLSRTPLVEPNGIAQALVERGNVVFLMTSYPHTARQRIDLSHWDIDAMVGIQRGLDTRGTSVRSEMAHVLHSPVPSRRADAEESWLSWFDDEEASVVSIGSPRACRASEQMLGRMLRVSPYMEPQVLSAPLPFSFLWAKGEMNFTSRFTATPMCVAPVDRKLAKKMRDDGAAPHRAIVTREAVFAERTRGDKTVTYGIFVAQRRNPRRTARTRPTWLAVCGLSGPATLGVANLLGNLPSTFTARTEGEVPGVVWGVVEVQLGAGDRPGDNRVLEDTRMIGGLREIEGSNLSA